MKAPFHRLTKAEIVWLANHTCTAHRHTYITHYNCYVKEVGTVPERIGFFDIETSDLVADYGIMLTYCYKVQGEDTILSGRIEAKHLKVKGHEDRELVRQCLTDLAKFDKIVTYYGKRFDAPFLRTRAVMNGLNFPFFGAVKHIDVYDAVRHRFRFRSNRLENACRNLIGKTDKTHLDGPTWRAAYRGDTEALDYVMDHNRKDVTDLEKLYNVVLPFTRKNDTSI